MTKIDAVNSALENAPYFALTPEMIRQLRAPQEATPSRRSTSEAAAENA